MPEQDMMQEMMTRSKPGKEHQLLAQHEGEWNTVLRGWMNPDEPPGEGKGTATCKMILDGRALTEEFHGSMMDMPFNGFGTMGFDNFRKKFWETWTDQMTALFCAEGTASPDGKTITFVGKMDMPEQNRKDVETRMVYHFLDKNHHLLEGFTKSPDGREYKMMELDYRRK